MAHRFTVGVEEEFQIVDPETWELRSHVSELLASSSASLGVRYTSIVEELQQLARSLLIFGLHVHVAVPDRTSAIDLMNAARYFLPHLLALSTSSPFWMGRDTGLKSYRTTVFRRFPRTGIPEHFDSWTAYEEYVDLLTQLHSIDNAKKIWWDLRPHPVFGTLEFRI